MSVCACVLTTFCAFNRSMFSIVIFACNHVSHTSRFSIHLRQIVVGISWVAGKRRYWSKKKCACKKRFERIALKWITRAGKYILWTILLGRRLVFGDVALVGSIIPFSLSHSNRFSYAVNCSSLCMLSEFSIVFGFWFGPYVFFSPLYFSILIECVLWTVGCS